MGRAIARNRKRIEGQNHFDAATMKVLTDDRWNKIALYLRPMDDQKLERIRTALDLQLKFSLDILRWTRDGDFDYRNKLNRIAEAEKALKEFSRKLYATSPDRAAYFPESLALLVIADMPEIDDEDDLSPMLTNENARAAFRKRLIDHQLALLLRKLSSLISHVKSELRQGAEGEVFGTSARMAERAALDRVIAAGCRIYRTRHSKIPAPRKKGSMPDGPFDKFMFAILEPLAEMLKAKGQYGWPTLLKRVDKVRAEMLTTPTH
jgi:hypothetical protein